MIFSLIFAVFAHAELYALVNSNGVVEQVIVASPEFIRTMPGRWVETTLDGSKGMRYAGPGYKFDEEKQVFVSPKPYNSYKLNKETMEWEPPIAKPVKQGKEFLWNEKEQKWDEKEIPVINKR
jgi:hypothetical protein